jgi:hypothetical protein
MDTRKPRSLAQRFVLGGSLVVLGIGLLVQAPRAAAPDSKDAPAAECTVENVAGAYGVLGSGTALPNSAGLPEGLVTTVGVLTFDGQGQWKTTNHTLIVTGQPTFVVSLSGTHTVNSDCIFTLIDTAAGQMMGFYS